MTKIRDPKIILKNGALIFLMLFIVAYIFFGAKDFIFGIKIKDVNIVEGQKIENNILNVTGNAKNAIELKLNNRVISIDQEGNFNETIALAPGYNVLKIDAKDNFGKTDSKNYKLMYE